MAGGVHSRGMRGRGGHVWQRGVCVAGVGGGEWHAWQERRPLKRAVRILLECILVFLVSTLYEKLVHIDHGPFVSLTLNGQPGQLQRSL